MITTFHLLQKAAPGTSPRNMTSLKGCLLLAKAWDGLKGYLLKTARARHVPWEEIPLTIGMEDVLPGSVRVMIYK